VYNATIALGSLLLPMKWLVKVTSWDKMAVISSVLAQ